jgi:hypothetical protein
MVKAMLSEAKGIPIEFHSHMEFGYPVMALNFTSRHAEK